MQYVAEIVDEIPGSGQQQYYFPKEDSTGGKDGLLVKVTPEFARPWIGIFAFGYPSAEAVSGIFEWHGADRICVVSKGMGHIITVDDPTDYSQIDVFPILHAFSIPEKALLIFGDFVKMAAYAPNERIWETLRLSWDGLKIQEVAADKICGEGWDAPTGRWLPFVVNTETGLASSLWG